jgi:hypothetical protein
LITGIAGFTLAGASIPKLNPTTVNPETPTTSTLFPGGKTPVANETSSQLLPTLNSAIERLGLGSSTNPGLQLATEGSGIGKLPIGKEELPNVLFSKNNNPIQPNVSGKSPLSDDAVKISSGVDPNNISRSQLGELLGAGGNKEVFALGENQAIGVLKTGKNPNLLNQELELLNKLDKIGLPSVDARGPINVDGRPALVFERFAEGSKSTVKTVDGKVRVVGDSPLLNQRSIDDLNAIRKTLVNDKIKVDDLQFLIGQDGRVVIADPLAVTTGVKPSRNNLRTIDLLIESAQKNK